MNRLCLLCSNSHPVYIQLNCGHSFGKICLSTYIFESKFERNNIPCPQCFTPINNAALDSILHQDAKGKSHHNPNHKHIQQPQKDPIIQAIQERSKEFFQCDCGYRYCNKCNQEWTLTHSCENVAIPLNDKYPQMKCRKCTNNMSKHRDCNILTCICRTRYCYACGAYYHKKHYGGLLECQGPKSSMDLGIFILLNIVFAFTFPLSILFVGIRFYVNAIRRSLSLQSETCKKVCLVMGFIVGLVVVGPIAYGLFVLPYFVMLWIRIGVFIRRYFLRKQLMILLNQKTPGIYEV
jgi:hypothetical protein